MVTDEEIERVTIGAPSRHDAPITLAEYDPNWPALFVREAERIGTVLGDRALRIEHVGSTSVPGLAAKPIIDIVLEVSDASDEPSYVPDLDGAGYVLRIREPDWFEHRLLKGPDTNVNLHVFGSGCPEIDRMVRFRDHLRADAGDRALYQQTKRDLAVRTWRYVQHYADAKAEVIAAIMARAMGEQ